MTRRKFNSKFKTTEGLEALKEWESLSELAQKHELLPIQINKQKREFIDNASEIFESPQTDKRIEAEKEKDRLLKPSERLKLRMIF